MPCNQYLWNEALTFGVMRGLPTGDAMEFATHYVRVACDRELGLRPALAVILADFRNVFRPR